MVCLREYCDENLTYNILSNKNWNDIAGLTYS